MRVPASSAGRVPSLALALLVVSGCATTPTITTADHTPAEIVAFLNTHTDAVYWSEKQLHEAASARTKALQGKCTKMGGVSDWLEGAVSFVNKNRPDVPWTRTIQEGSLCTLSGQASWGVSFTVADGVFQPGSSGGGLYHGKVVFELIDADRVQQMRQEHELAHQKALQQFADCKAQVAHETEQLRSDPQVAMLTQYGVAIDVRKPMVSIQLSVAARDAAKRETQWIDMKELVSGRTCPLAR
jgi:hypothetical protein